MAGQMQLEWMTESVAHMEGVLHRHSGTENAIDFEGVDWRRLDQRMGLVS